MKKHFFKYFFLVIVYFMLLGLSNHSFGQEYYAKGVVKDFDTRETLIGANIINSSREGIITDSKGEFILQIKKNDTLQISYLGYSHKLQPVSVTEKEVFLEIFLISKHEQLNETVISESRYEQKLSEVTVSMNIIKPQTIENSNDLDIETVLQKTSGVEIRDGQPSIRGGSGYSYGAGSRVLMLLNDLPLLSADAGDVKWNFIPLENLAQIEIIKGASSVVYGSSALNGVINFRTAFAKAKPETKINLISGNYFDPKRKELVWTEEPRSFYGFNVMHSHKIKNSDFVISSDYFNDKGYRENEYEKRTRFNFNYLHRDTKIKGLSYGVNSNIMKMDKIDFFLWQNADSGAYKQNLDAISELSGLRFNIDPGINYVTATGARHSLKSRYFYVDNRFKDDSSKNSKAQSVFTEYQFIRNIGERIKLVSGFSNKYAQIDASLYGNHFGTEYALYSQFEKRFYSKFKLLFGFRFEQYFQDGNKESLKPVFRSGINYQPFEYTNIRASFGQGYRYPSIAEKYTTTSVGALNIFPNPLLNEETGNSLEFGIMQNLKLKSWQLMLDFALFRTRYNNMIEFIFGVYKPDSVPIATLDHVGFKSFNVSNALIKGIDFNMQAAGNVFNIPVKIQFGYVFNLPKDLDYQASHDSLKDGEILKYRHLHILKSDIQFKYKKITLGCNWSYHSKMVNIDSVFIDPFIGELILPGFSGYWEENNNSYSIFNFRMGVNISSHSNISLVFKNAFNKEYLIRPGDISQPRNISIKYALKI